VANTTPSRRRSGSRVVSARAPQNSEKYIRNTASPVNAEATTTSKPRAGNRSTAPSTSISWPTKPSVPGNPVQASPSTRKLVARSGICS
jgi:hypothetical protein